MSSKKDLEKAKKLKEACLESFKLPENFEEKLKTLENEMEKSKFSQEKLMELLELYSKAAQHYDSINKQEEVVYYLDKVKQLGSHDKTKEFMGRRKSKELVNVIKLNIDDKKEQIEKIKALIKQSEKTNKQDTSSIIENYSVKKNNTQDILNKDIDDQTETFKKRMVERKIQKMNSLPSFNKNKSKSSFKSNPITEPIVVENKETTPKRKKSILSSQVLDQPSNPVSKKNTLIESKSKENFASTNKRRSLLNCDTPLIVNNDSIENCQKSEKISSGGKNNIPLPSTNSSKKNGVPKKKLDLNMDDIIKGNGNQAKVLKTMKNKVQIDEEAEEMFDEEFNNNIECQLEMIWEKAQKDLEEKLISIEEKIFTLVEDLLNEKSKRINEINEKYDKEMKEIEPDVDFEDEGNINTIVYNQLKDDKENELKRLTEEFDRRRREGMSELREETRKIEKSEKNTDFECLKNEITQSIKERIIKTITPKVNFTRKFDFNKVSLKNYATNIDKKISLTSSEFTHSTDNDNLELNEENRDKVGTEDILMKPKKITNSNRPMWKHSTSLNNSNRRISTGLLMKREDNKD